MLRRQEVAGHVRGGKVLESAFLPCSLSQGVISPHFLIRPTLPLSPSWPNHVQEKVRSNVVGLKLLREKSKTFLRLAEEEEEEGAGKTVQVCGRGSSSCSRFRALSLPRQRQGSESQPGCLRGSKRAVVWPQEPRRGQGAPTTGASHCGRAPGQPQHLQGLCLKVRRILCQEM